MLGAYPSRPNETFTFNSRNLFFLFCLVQSIIFIAGFFMFEAQSMGEYGITFFMILTKIYAMLGLLLLLWRIRKILELISKLEEFIEKSE